MQTKRKVKNFDITQPIMVDVSNSGVEEKKKVQQAFFDVGIKWLDGVIDCKKYKFLDSEYYANVTHDGYIVEYLLRSSSTPNLGIKCITPKEFFKMVYEDEDKEAEGYTKVDDLNKFIWVLKDTSKEVYIELIKRDVKVESYCNFEGKDFCHNFWGRVVSADIHALPKYKGKLCKEVFFKDGEFYTKNSAIEFNYEEYCKGGYVAKTVCGLEVTQIKKFDIEGVFPIAGVVGGHIIQTWNKSGRISLTNPEDRGNLVMYKV